MGHHVLALLQRLAGAGEREEQLRGGDELPGLQHAALRGPLHRVPAGHVTPPSGRENCSWASRRASATSARARP